ncbi:MAG: transposase, partial [Desulfobulbus sp.]|nr:transposase [Desulfobulbus sp.]
SRSAAGSIEQPGKNVRAKAGLNKAILDQGWSEFRRQLDYKLAWQGGRLIAVPPQYTSQICPRCGCKSADNRQTQAKFVCVECGFEEHADVVGAINVLARGRRVAACGEMAPSGRSKKQEPAEATRSGNAPATSAVGIPFFQGGEDVNSTSSWGYTALLNQ